MADLVGMLLQAKIDPDAVSKIQQQIEEISKNAEKIKIHIDVDDKVFKNIENINKQLKKATTNINTDFRIDGTDGQLDKFKQIEDKVKNTIRYVSELTTAEKEYIKLLQDENGEVLKIEKSRNYKKELQELQKIIDFQEEYVTKTKEMYAKDIIPKDTLREFEGLVNLLDVDASKKDMDMIKAEYGKLVDLEKQLTKAGTERRKEITGAFKEDLTNTKNLIQLEEKLKNIRFNLDNKSKIDKNSQDFKQIQDEYNAILNTLEKYKTTNQNITEDEKVQINTRIADLKRLTDEYNILHTATQKEEIRIKKMGENLGSISGMNFADDEQMKKFLLSLQETGAEIVRFERTLNTSGQEQIKMTTRTQQTNNMVKEQKFVVDENTQALYKQSEALKPNINRMLGWAESMKVAMVKSVQWAIAMHLLYGNIQKLKDGIVTIKDLQFETQQIQMVTKMSTEEVNKLTQAYGDLAQELSTNVLDITKSATTFFRQGLDTDTVEDRIVNTTKLSKVLGISMEETAEKMTAGINSMGIEAERLGDVVTKVGAKAGTSGEEILTIIQRAGATAKQANISLEELAAIGGVISEATRLPAETIGTSINTILSKFQEVNAVTGEINEDFGKVVQTIESVGIQAVDRTTGELRNVMDILSDIGAKWDSLSKKEQQLLTSAMGVRQFNRFAVLLQNSTRQMELLSDAQNSQNEMTEQYGIYLNSVEAASERAKNSLQMMWQNAIQPEKIRMFYDFSTAIIKTVDKIGVLNVAIMALSTIFLLASKNYRSFTSLLSDSIKEMGLLQGTVFTLGVAVDILRGKFDIAKVKAIGLQVATLGLQAALTLGLSFAISKAIGWIDKQINKYNELKVANQELIQTYRENVTANNQNIQRLQELSSSYDKIRDKINNQIELNDEEKRTLSEIIAINPSIVQGYDERGQAIIDTTKNIKDMTDALQDANKLEDVKLLQGGEGLFKEAKKDIKDVQSEIEKLNGQIRSIDGSAEQVKNMGRMLTSGSLALLTRNRELLEEKQKSGIELTKKEEETFQKLNLEIERQTLERDNLVKQLDIHRQALVNNSIEVQNAIFAHIRLSDSYKDMSHEMKTFIGEYVKTLNVMDFDSFIDMQIAVDGFVDALKNADFNEAAKDYKNLAEQFKKGDLKAKDFDEAVQKIITKLLKIKDIPEDIITRFFKHSDEMGDLSEQLDDIEDGFNANKEALEKYTDQYEGLTSKLQEYYVILDELNSKEGLSAKSKQDIITKYQELLPYIDNEKELRRQLMTIIKKEEEAQHTAYKNMIIYSEDFFNAKIKGNDILVKTLGEFYTEDLKNAKSLADAKEIVEASLIKNLSGMWREYYNAASSNLLVEADYRRKLDFGYGTAEEKQAMRAAINAIDQQKEVARRFDELANNLSSGRNFKDINMDKIKDPKSQSGSKSKKDEYKAEADRYARINLELDKNNALLQKNKTLQDLAGNDLAKKISLMEEEIRLNKQRQKSLNDLNNERRKEVKELEKSLSKQGFKFSGTGDNRMITNLNNIKGKTKEVETQFNRYMQLQKTEIPQASQEWWNLQSSIEKVKLDKSVSEFELADQQVNKLQKSLSQLEYQFKLLEDTDLEGKADNIAKQIAILKKEVKLAEDELEQMGEVGEDSLQVVKDRQEELNKRIQDGTLAIDALEKSLVDLRETARQEWIKEKNELAQAQQDRLRALDQIQEQIVAIIRKRGEEEKKALDKAHKEEMDSLEERHKERKQKYKDELDEFKKMIQSKIDALDEQWDEEDYLEDLEKEREEANRLQKEIDVLSLDDSLTARNKVIELRKQLAKQNEKIAKMQQKKERDLLKKSLQDQLKQHEKDAKDKEDIADSLYENEKKRLEEEYRINKEFLDKKYSDEQVYAEAKKAIMDDQVQYADGSFMSILDSFRRFEDEFGRGMGILGDIIKEDFIEQLRLAQSVAEEMERNTFKRLPKYDSDYQPRDDEWDYRDPEDYNKPEYNRPPEFINWSKSDYDEYIQNKKDWEKAKDEYEQNKLHVRNMMLRYKYWGTGRMNEDKYHWRDLVNWKGYSEGGKNITTGLAMLHGTKQKPEYIFNHDQFKDLAKMIAQYQFTPNINTLKIPKVQPRQGITLQIDNFIKADTITKDSIPELRKYENNAMSRLKNELNKFGVRPARV